MQILKTTEYDKWFKKLKDLSAKAKINARLRRIELHGKLLGDSKPLGGNVVELKFDFGPGYRVYLMEEVGTLILLLIGGDKSTQEADIRQAKKLANEWRKSK